MNDLKTISIDRASKSFAIFGAGMCLEKPFESYLSEESALVEAKKWLAERAVKDFVIVYPRIMGMTYTARR